MDAKTFLAMLQSISPSNVQNTNFEVRVVNGLPYVGRVTEIEGQPQYVRVGRYSGTQSIVAVAHVVGATPLPT